jgi:hypothetical protein
MKVVAFKREMGEMAYMAISLIILKNKCHNANFNSCQLQKEKNWYFCFVI